MLTSTYKWSFIERIIVQIFQLTIIIITSRYIPPKEFGAFGITAVVVSISQVFIDSGFTSALIRKKEHTQEELSSVFFTSILISIGCVSIIYFSSPFIGRYYLFPELTELLRISSIVILVNSFAIIPKVILTVRLDFKSIASSSIIAVIISGIISVTLAIHSYGVFALLMQVISYNSINIILLSFRAKWMPDLIYNFSAIKKLSHFSIKLLLSGLIDAFYQNSYTLFIGKQMSIHDVGIFSQGKRLSDIPALTITNALQRANLAETRNINEKGDKCYQQYLINSIQFSMLFMIPTMILLSIISTPLVSLLIGEKWNDSSLIISILSISGCFYPLHVLNQNILIIKGRSDLHLKLEFVKKIIGFSFLLVTLPFGLIWLCIGILVHSFLSVFINAYYSFQLIGVTIKQQLKVCIIPILIGLIGWGGESILNHLVLFFLTGYDVNHYVLSLITIIIALLSFVISYLAISFFFYKNELSKVMAKIRGKNVTVNNHPNI
ncbi:lipopolysaccharide biosynthesis protein [Edwardsiella tarda]|uniref:lipopolysaccharide biosynthesis protein n=1 Tax=Edwardsiella tarda TaxID=636 RepID=UPI000D520262|nr:lipopolysaccharide biosynthesis protein [Edwardsiella tarda]UCQ10404.1 lipopolysaccharide biosynthesis protein [Edwardsiella tarda]